MHPLEVSIIVGILFVILTFLIDFSLYNVLGYKCCELSVTSQYMVTFLTVFLFSMTIEYTELNDLVCSGNH